jgi:hypothetical protein
VTKIGCELGVRHVLEGSVQRGSSRIRVNVQVIDAANGNHFWAERFDKALGDLLDMQDEIVADRAKVARHDVGDRYEYGGPLYRRDHLCQRRYVKSPNLSDQIDAQNAPDWINGEIWSSVWPVLGRCVEMWSNGSDSVYAVIFNIFGENVFGPRQDDGTRCWVRELVVDPCANDYITDSGKVAFLLG